MNMETILASTDKCIAECCVKCVGMCAMYLQFCKYCIHAHICNTMCTISTLAIWSVNFRRGMGTCVQGHARCRCHVPDAKFACAVKAKVSTRRVLCRHNAQMPWCMCCGNPDITREIHMRSERKYPVTVGNIDCRVLKYKVLPPKQPQDTRAQMFVM